MAEVAFCLDIDGTLVLTDDIYFEAFRRLLEPFGHVVDQAFYDKHVHGKVDADVFSTLMPAGTSTDELAAMSRRKDDLFCELYREHTAANGPPALPGLAEALASAQQLGVRCIAVTNAPRGAAEECIASLRATMPSAAIIADTIVIGAECKRAKPHPEPYLEGMRLLGTTPDRTIVFEDSTSGVRAGVAAGVRAVVGLRSCMGDAELRALGASASVEDWTGVTPDFLLKLVDATARPPTAKKGTADAATATPRGPVSRTPALALLLLSIAASAIPAAIADSALLCKGADTKLPSAAMRSYGASLLPLVALMAGGRPSLPRQRLAVACALLATCATQASSLQADGHALRRWARWSFALPVLVAGASGAAAAGALRG